MSEAAASQGKFWEMHDRLFEHQDALEHTALARHARKIGLDVPPRRARAHRGIHAARVERDAESGEPSAFVAPRRFSSMALRYRGPRDRASLVAALASAAMAPALLEGEGTMAKK